MEPESADRKGPLPPRDPLAPSTPAGSTPRRSWRPGWIIPGLLIALLAGGAVWLRRDRPRPADIAVEREVGRLLGEIRKEERRERLAARRSGFSSTCPRPFSSLGKAVFGDGSGTDDVGDQLQALGTAAAPALVDALKRDRSPAVRTAAAEALGGLEVPDGRPSADQHAVARRHRRSPPSRGRGFGEDLRSGAGPALIASLGRDTNAQRSRSPRQRGWGQINDPKAMRVACSGFRRTTRKNQSVLCRLGARRTGADRSDPCVGRCLATRPNAGRSQRRRRSAQNFDDASSIPPLIEALAGDATAEVRSSAARALEVIARRMRPRRSSRPWSATATVMSAKRRRALWVLLPTKRRSPRWTLPR